MTGPIGEQLKQLIKNERVGLEELIAVGNLDLLAKAQPFLEQRERHATLAYLRRANAAIEAECRQQQFVNNEMRALVDAGLNLAPVNAGGMSLEMCSTYIDSITEQYLCGVLNLEEKSEAIALLRSLIHLDSRGSPLELKKSSRFVQFLIDNKIVVSTPSPVKGRVLLSLA